MNTRRAVLSLAVSAALLAPISAHAASCNVSNVLYAINSNIRIPCVQIGDQTVNASFKIRHTENGHFWELQQVTPTTGNPSGARATFSSDGHLRIPLIQLVDGSLWQADVQYAGQSAEGGYLFGLTDATPVNALSDLIVPLPRDKFFSFPAKKSLAHAATLPFLPDSSGVSRPPSPLCGFGTLLPP